MDYRAAFRAQAIGKKKGPRCGVIAGRVQETSAEHAHQSVLRDHHKTSPRNPPVSIVGRLTRST